MNRECEPYRYQRESFRERKPYEQRLRGKILYSRSGGRMGEVGQIL